MKFTLLANTFKKLDSTTKRLEMIDILMELFDRTPAEEFREVIYLTSGKIGADYQSIDLGFADRMVIKAISKAIGQSEYNVDQLFKKLGDLGEVAEQLIGKTGQQQLELFLPKDDQSTLTIKEIWESLNKIAESVGSGSSERKTRILLGLYAKASPLEAKYITRIVLSQLRLGVKDLTIIEALARKFGQNKDAREIIEHAYNVTSDIGEVGEVLALEGLEAVKKLKINVGRPIRMMAAQRMASTEEILEKLGGTCALEFKYDGERVQAHISDKEIILYSRNLNDITEMYPDVKKAMKEVFVKHNIIVEGEIVAWDTDEKKMKPFQTLMSRKRKYDIEKMMEAIPVKVFLFDILFLDGKGSLSLSYPERRKMLESVVKDGNEIITLSTREIVSNVNGFENFFEKAVENGCEGIMAKDIRKETPYQSGNRGFLWIKHKFDYSSSFADSYDFVVVGGFYGKGRRTGTLGTLLMAAYNPELERFETVCKLGTGFSDEDLEKITTELLEIKAENQPKDVFSKIKPDIWIYPEQVYEVQGADLSTSPVHTCALDEIQKDVGIAIRFPRFIKFRKDKSADLATTTSEVIDAYQNQRLQK